MQSLTTIGLLPCINAGDADAARRTARALNERGVSALLFESCSRVHFDAIKSVRSEYPNMTLGLLLPENPQDIRDAASAGINFVVIGAQELTKVCISNMTAVASCQKKEAALAAAKNGAECLMIDAGDMGEAQGVLGALGELPSKPMIIVKTKACPESIDEFAKTAT